jgi:hypothetical protein
MNKASDELVTRGVGVGLTWHRRCGQVVADCEQRCDDAHNQEQGTLAEVAGPVMDHGGLLRVQEKGLASWSCS